MVDPGVRPTSPLDESLVAPFVRIEETAAAGVLEQGWGLTATSLRRLDTERDDTYLVTHATGRHVLKVAHPLDDPAVLDLQCTVLRFAAARDPVLPLPHLVPDLDGVVMREVRDAASTPRLARLLTYLPGRVLDYATTTPGQRRSIGRAAGRLSLALSEVEHAASTRVHAWDLQHFGTLRTLLGHVADPAARVLVGGQLDAYDGHLGAALSATRQQIVHHDLNADNLLVDPDVDPEVHPGPDAFVIGILDFGDVVRSSVVGDLAVAMSYAVDSGGVLDGDLDTDPWTAPYQLAQGFQEVRSLAGDEQRLLPHLVTTRLAQRLLLNSWLASTDPANAHYTGRSIARSGLALRRLLETPSPSDREGA